MDNENYVAEKIWLQEHIRHSRRAELSVEFQTKMGEMRLGLMEVFDVVESGTMEWADRDYDGCRFKISGRNCDEQLFRVEGRFNSSELYVAFEKLEKIGANP